jgi:hypothetical protein
MIHLPRQQQRNENTDSTADYVAYHHFQINTRHCVTPDIGVDAKDQAHNHNRNKQNGGIKEIFVPF